MVDKCCLDGSKKQKELLSLKKDFDILNDVNRLRILCLVKKHDEICVCDINESLGLSQNLVSYHLGKLKDAGFVESNKQGSRVLYRQGVKKAKEFEKIIINLLNN
ncbi:MAG: metalloregulator ArsR/SmtB family transcription factor [Patescibacteria group bacterium]|jgi:ArsR family transcriptional regulator|nr:metalloregulator ArsR/SmtB family transcription factor [Patescibacteria group bacterium]